MPGKTAKSAPLPPFGLSGMTALVRAATLSCENAGKSQKCTQDRESSGESRLISLRLRSRRSSSVADGSLIRSIAWAAISDAFAALFGADSL